MFITHKEIIRGYKLNKILLFLLLLTSLYSDAKIYMGMNAGYFNENFLDNLDAKNSTVMTSFKVGYGVREAYAIEFSVDWVENKSKIFSENDGDKYGINVEVIKGFNLHRYINPFFKAGFGSGNLQIDRELQNRLSFGSFNIGAGLFIPLNHNFDIEIGYNYRYMTYEKVDRAIDDFSYESHANILYTGFNVRF